MPRKSEINCNKKCVDTRKRSREQTTTPEEPEEGVPTPKKIKTNLDDLQQAKNLLICNSSHPCLLPGRETQIEELQKFIHSLKTDSSSNSLYVSGPPGTGKTAAINQTLQENSSEFQTIFINCTSIKSSSSCSIFRRLAAELGLTSTSTQRKSFLIEAISEELKKQREKEKKKILLVLDEIDQLATGSSKRQSALYEIFQLCIDHRSEMALIGVANVLDFTQRVLPLLVHPPQLLHFPPYTKAEILEIFRSRLDEKKSFFSGEALGMLAGKVAAVSGDARRALHLAKRLLNLRDEQPVEIQQVQTVLNNIYCNETEESETQAIPLQQKIVICSLIILLRRKKSQVKGITLGEVQEVYAKLCKKNNVQCIDYDFLGVCLLAETRGMINVIKDRRLLRLSKVSLRKSEDEVLYNLRNDGFCMKMIGEDV